MYIYIDIETIRGPEMDPIEEFEAPANYTKPESIQAYKVKAQQEAWEKQSLVSIKGNIAVLCASINGKGVSAFSAMHYHEERKIIANLWDMIRGTKGFDGMKVIKWVGFNLRRFDMNWIYHRALKYGMRELALIIPRERYSKNIIDLQEFWQSANNNEKGTLKGICDFLGMPPYPEVDIDGSQVYDYWKAGKIDEIIKHCKFDVQRVIDLHPIMDPTFSLD